ncbi:hypothetical protein [uncultured Williamsia sp.]|uniref:hypothetical protein n=1 Tax=uncultured Williamsia sp. TaxID=259311 RepID=UPI002634426C|nr:hypothetical protein [uncultured Williamsia sp.]
MTELKSIADHVAHGESLADTARALGITEAEVTRWAQEMMTILKVDTLDALVDRLRHMQYGAPTTQPWRRSLFTRSHPVSEAADSVA